MSESNTQAPRYEKKNRSKTPVVVAIIAIVALVAAVAVYFVLNREDGASGKTITVGLVLEPTSLDVRTNEGAATGQVLLDNVYQGLVGIKPGTITEIVPVLATEMPTVASDGREYSFTVREGVKFHSGATLTADDVVESLRTTLVPGVVGFQATVEKSGEHGVKIGIEQPNSLLIWYLANTPGIVLEKGATNDIKNSANGTGPFRFSNWKQGDNLTFVKNPDYWGDEAQVDRVVFRFFKNGRTAANALKDGDTDVQTALVPQFRAEFENDSKFTLERAESSDVFTLAYNSAKAPFNDPRVRTALSIAIDGAAIVAAWNGDGKPLGGPITSLEPGYADLTSVNPYDPDRARALLAEAGQQNLSLTITVPNIYDTASLDLISSQLAAVGVSAKLNTVEFGTWLTDVYVNHDFDLSFVDHVEARDFGNYANPGYYFGYSNAEVQKLFADALATLNPAEEEALLKQAAELVAVDAPAKWLFNYTPTNVVSTKVSGFPTANTNSRINLVGVSVE